MAFPWAAVIAAASQIGGSLLNNYSNKQSEADAFERQKELTKMQNDYNLEMWKLNNEYNLPSKQLERLLSAGYTNSGALSAINSNNSSSPNSSGTASVGMLPRNIGDNIARAGELAIQALKTKAEINNINADTENKEANTETINQSRVFELNKIQKEIDKFSAEIGLIKEQKNQLDILTKYLDQKSEEEIKLIVENRKQIEQQTLNLTEENKKLVWENYYKDNFGIDPNSDIMKQLVTASLSGKAEPIWNALEKTVNYVFNKVSSIYNNNIDNLLTFDNGNGFTITKDDLKNPLLSAINKGVKQTYKLITKNENDFNNWRFRQKRNLNKWWDRQLYHIRWGYYPKHNGSFTW